MKTNKTISLDVDLVEKIFDREESLSKVVNTLLKEYLGEENIKESKKEINNQIKQLEKRKEGLKKKQTQKKKQERQEKKKETTIKESQLPKEINDWLEIKETRPSVLEMVAKLKTIGLETTEEIREEVNTTWERLHE